MLNGPVCDSRICAQHRCEDRQGCVIRCGAQHRAQQEQQWEDALVGEARSRRQSCSRTATSETNLVFRPVSSRTSRSAARAKSSPRSTSPPGTCETAAVASD